MDGLGRKLVSFKVLLDLIRTVDRITVDGSIEKGKKLGGMRYHLYPVIMS